MFGDYFLLCFLLAAGIQLAQHRKGTAGGAASAQSPNAAVSCSSHETI